MFESVRAIFSPLRAVGQRIEYKQWELSYRIAAVWFFRTLAHHEQTKMEE